MRDKFESVSRLNFEQSAKCLEMPEWKVSIYNAWRDV